MSQKIFDLKLLFLSLVIFFIFSPSSHSQILTFPTDQQHREALIPVMWGSSLPRTLRACGLSKQKYEIICGDYATGRALSVYGTSVADNIRLTCETSSNISCSSKGQLTIPLGFCPGATQVYVYTFSGNDRIDATELCAMSHDDNVLFPVYLNGGNGNDRIKGSINRDWVRGESGNDFIEGNCESDFIEGGAGNDNLYADRPSFVCPLHERESVFGHSIAEEGRNYTGSDDDCIEGGEENVTLMFGQRGNDHITGAGNCEGGSGNDRCQSECPPERLSFANSLNGYEGNDRLIGSPCYDFFDGGPGDDAIYAASEEEDNDAYADSYWDSGGDNDILVVMPGDIGWASDFETIRCVATLGYPDFCPDFCESEEYCDPEYYIPNSCTPPW